MAQSDARPTGDQKVACSISAGVRKHYFVETDHEIYFYGHFSVDSKRDVVRFWRKNVQKDWFTAEKTKHVQEKCN